MDDAALREFAEDFERYGVTMSFDERTITLTAWGKVITFGRKPVGTGMQLLKALEDVAFLHEQDRIAKETRRVS